MSDEVSGVPVSQAGETAGRSMTEDERRVAISHAANDLVRFEGEDRVRPHERRLRDAAIYAEMWGLKVLEPIALSVASTIVAKADDIHALSQR